ncbi:MAG: hypothetical protein IKS41_01700 [Alphaproteobacteria bacterium]|nr:hypothetical protein [Alphaproteobacteria bacterium]
MKSSPVLSFLRKTVPFFICFIIILLSQIPNARFIFDTLIFIPIFYFAIFRPTILNVCAVFGLGLFADLINQTPLGILPFTFVLLFFIARFNRLFLKDLSFKTLWIFFGFCSTLLLLIQLFLFTLSEGTTVHTKFFFQQLTVLILIYPVGIHFFARLNDWIGDTE